MLDQAELRKREYTGRINRVMDYVRENLDGDLRLEKLARIANFSPYHFHRVFKAIVGETTNAYIRRHRAEKAACHLVQNSRMSITEIAMACGYSSSSSFAREFRQMYGMSATQFRDGGHSSLKTLRETVEGSSEAGPDISAPVPRRAEMVFRAAAIRLPKRHVAYIRHVAGPTTRSARHSTG